MDEPYESKAPSCSGIGLRGEERISEIQRVQNGEMSSQKEKKEGGIEEAIELKNTVEHVQKYNQEHRNIQGHVYIIYIYIHDAYVSFFRTETPEAGVRATIADMYARPCSMIDLTRSIRHFPTAVDLNTAESNMLLWWQRWAKKETLLSGFENIIRHTLIRYCTGLITLKWFSKNNALKTSCRETKLALSFFVLVFFSTRAGRRKYFKLWFFEDEGGREIQIQGEREEGGILYKRVNAKKKRHVGRTENAGNHALYEVTWFDRSAVANNESLCFVFFCLVRFVFLLFHGFKICAHRGENSWNTTGRFWKDERRARREKRIYSFMWLVGKLEETRMLRNRYRTRLISTSALTMSKGDFPPPLFDNASAVGHVLLFSRGSVSFSWGIKPKILI